MNSQKLKLQFQPRKFSESKSKEKYSPYRISKKKGKSGLLQVENQQRLDLNQPLIKFQRLVVTSSSKRELKLSNDLPHQKNQPHQEKQLEKIPLFTQKCQFCLNLGRKIDQQTHFLKRNYREIVKKLELNDNANLNSPYNQEYQRKLSQIAENQHFMIKYLQQQKQKSLEDKQQIKVTHEYEKQIAKLKISILEWELRYKTLQLELSLISSQLAEKEKELQALTKFIEPTNTSNFTDILQITKEPIKYCKDQDECLEKKEGERLNQKLSEIENKWNLDFDKILTQFKQLKLQNQMLRQEIKLMFYEYSQKYKNQPRKAKMTLSNQTSKRTMKSLSNRKTNSQKNQISIQQNIGKQTQHNRIIRKKTNSYLMTSSDKLELEKQQSILNQLEENNIDSQPQEQSKMKTAPNSFYEVPQLKRMNTIEQNKVNMAKSFLKWNQDSIISKDEKDKMQKQKKQLNNYTQIKMNQLDLIRRTIFHRFKAYKFTYCDLQGVLINREQYNIKYQQMFQLLIQPPFSLELSTAKTLLQHIFRQYDIPLEKMEVFNSFFCNSLRQFISDYQLPEQQQEIRLIEKIKKKIFMDYNRLKSECYQYSDIAGLISEYNLSKILQRLKFNDLQIGIIISQCCLISKDADNLNHQQYLSIFSNKS